MYVDCSDPDDFINAIRPHRPGPGQCMFVLVAKASMHLIDGIIEKANADRIPIAGGIFAALIEGTTVHETGAIVQVFNVLAEPAIARIDGDAPEWTVPLPDLPPCGKAPTCLILTDYSCLKIDDVLDELFNRHADEVNYFGAAAGTGVREPRPVIFTNQGRFTGSALVAYLADEAEIGLRHGWSRLSEPMVATRTKDNVLKELNWEPAMGVYREIVGDDVADSLRDQEDIPKAKRFPFGIAREGLEDVVRDPLVSTGDTDLTLLSNVPENSVLHVLKAETDKLIAAAGELGGSFAPRSAPARCILFDCFSRVKLLGDQFDEELCVFNAALQSRVAGTRIEGVLASGEIASDGNRLPDMHNKTMAAALFHEL